MTQPLFSIVIPTYRRPQVLARTLECLEKQECGFPFELILVNDGPPEELPELDFGKDGRTNWRLIQNATNLKRAATRNRGIFAAQGKYVLMLDDDIWAVPGLLQAHFDKQQEIGGGVVVGAVPPSAEIKKSPWNRYIARRYENIHARLREKKLDFGLFLTGNVSIPRLVLEKAGGFDERFKEYSFEDSELGFRLHSEGVRFAHAAGAVGYHFYHEDLSRICLKESEAGRSLRVFVQLHPELVRIMQVHTLTLMPWKNGDIVKNLVKLVLFSVVFRMVLQLKIMALGLLGSDSVIFLLLPWLELTYRAKGFREGRVCAVR